jgi:PKD repeat protein
MGEGRRSWFARLLGGGSARRDTTTGTRRSVAFVLCLGVVSWLCFSSAWAETPAGTVITNAALLTYDAGTVESNTTEVIVSHVAGVDVTPATAARAGCPGETVSYRAVLTNTGSGDDSFSLGVASDSGWASVVYLDENGDGVHQETETTVLSSTGVVQARAQVACVVAVSVPLDAVGGDVSVLHVASSADPTCFATANYRTDVVPDPVVTPVADFTGSPRRGRAPLMVSFQDLSTGDPFAWEWHFGDGAIGLEQNPVHAYVEPGPYTVSLTVTTAEGCATKTKHAFVLVRFHDVPDNHWARNEIMACAQAGILTGYPDGNYHPELPVTRAQMAAFVSRALVGGDANVPEGPADASFSDVPTDFWAYDYVEYARRRNIILGYPDALYHPEALVNRAGMAVFIARSIVDPTGDQGLASYAPPGTPTFGDVSGANAWSWSYEHVEYVARQGIVSGYPDGLYHPEHTCSRDQMAVFFARAFELSP